MNLPNYFYDIRNRTHCYNFNGQWCQSARRLQPQEIQQLYMQSCQQQQQIIYDQMQRAPQYSRIPQHPQPQAPNHNSVNFTPPRQVAAIKLENEIDTREDCQNQIPELAQRLGFREEDIRSWGRIIVDSNDPKHPISIQQRADGSSCFQRLTQDSKTKEFKWEVIDSKKHPELFAALAEKYPQTTQAKAPAAKKEIDSESFHPQIFPNNEEGWGALREAGLNYKFTSIKKLKSDILFYKDAKGKKIPVVVTTDKKGQKTFLNYRNGDLSRITDPKFIKTLESTYNQLMMNGSEY